jgi:hypothetical protein
MLRRRFAEQRRSLRSRGVARHAAGSMLRGRRPDADAPVLVSEAEEQRDERASPVPLTDERDRLARTSSS